MAETDIIIEAEGWSALDGLEPLVRASVEAALAGSGVAVRADVELSVLLADDATLRDLNKRWRQIDKATNVLSFPAATAEAIARAPHLGDIAIAIETLRAEAQAESKTPASHLAHLVVHGVLHLLGFDHLSDDEAEVMEGRERAILATLGVADPYAEPA
jgi:probable rRNA maturation factor